MFGQPVALLPLAFFMKPTHWMLICINMCEIGCLGHQFTSMAASILPDLNCTPLEDLDGGTIPEEGEAAAHQDVDALAQDEGDDSDATGIGSTFASSSLLF